MPALAPPRPAPRPRCRCGRRSCAWSRHFAPKKRRRLEALAFFLRQRRLRLGQGWGQDQVGGREPAASGGADWRTLAIPGAGARGVESCSAGRLSGRVLAAAVGDRGRPQPRAGNQPSLSPSFLSDEGRGPGARPRGSQAPLRGSSPN
jgi:hypothetical protein